MTQEINIVPVPNLSMRVDSEMAESIIQWCAVKVAEFLGTSEEDVDVNEPFASYGLGSTKSVMLSGELEDEFNMTIPPTVFLADASIRQIISSLFQQDADRTSENAASPITATETPVEDAALSRNQESMWFINQLAPKIAVYNLSTAVRIIGELDLPAFERALQRIVDRHASLRTLFPIKNRKAVQFVQPSVEFHCQIVDATTFTEDQLRNAMSEEAHRPFQLQQGPLMRVTLFKKSLQETYLLFVFHHMIMDGWSYGIFFSELGLLYGEETSGEPAPLATLPLQYTDFSRWQHELLTTPVGERLLSFWEGYLADVPHRLEIPSERVRPKVQSYKGSTLGFQFDAELTGKLKEFSTRHRVTMYTLLLAAFHLLLFSSTDQRDQVVGSPVTGRNHKGLNGLIGNFVNMIPVRNVIDENASFLDYLEQVSHSVLAAIEHQDYPFPVLVDKLRIQRDLSSSPLFQHSFVWQEVELGKEAELTAFAFGDSKARINLGSLVMEVVPLEKHVSMFDTTMTTGFVGDKTWGTLQYNTDLYDAGLASRLVQGYESLLRNIVGGPTLRNHDLLTW